MTTATAFETPQPGSVTIFGPDFPFAYDDWLRHPAGLGSVPEAARGATVAIVGAGLAGLVAAYELMELGLRPVVYEPTRVGGRLRSHEFEGADGIVAELGGMRFPVSGRSFFHYADRVGLDSAPFPNPLTPAAGSTVVDIGGQTFHGSTLGELPGEFADVASAWDEALEQIGFSAIQDAIRDRDVAALKRLWNELVPVWDGRTFYDFVATSPCFSKLPFRYREMFGLVGFGTGGWDSDFPNSMLEILRVVVTNCDTDQRLIVGGAEQLPRRLWTLPVSERSPWPAGTTLASLHDGCRARALPPSTGTTTAGSRSATAGAAAGCTTRCSPPARAGCSPPRSSATRASSRTSCGWRSTAPGTCSRPRRS